MDSWEQTEDILLHSRKSIKNYRLENGGLFVSYTVLDWPLHRSQPTRQQYVCPSFTEDIQIVGLYKRLYYMPQHKPPDNIRRSIILTEEFFYSIVCL